MSNELISILVLVAVFLISTTMGINMGVLGVVAAFGLGTALGVSEDDIFAGFPGDLFVILVGVTLLFGIASNNGTVDWLIQAAVKAVKGRTVAIPWVFFLVTAVLTASGAVVPGAVAIVAPIALGFAVQYGINPVLMGLFVINGATAGGFSPISVFGSIVNGVVEREDLAENSMLLFASSFVFNFLLCIVVFFLFGGRKLIGHRVEPGETVDEDGTRSGRFEREVQEREKAGTGPKPIAGGAATTAPAEVPELDRDKILTLVGILSLIVVALAFDVDVGFVSFSIAAVLMLISPKASKGAVEKVAWSTVLLICGIVMYVGLLEQIGTIDWLGEQVADHQLRAARGAADLLRRRRGVRVRLHHRHPRRADPARGAVPGDRRGRRGRPDHRAVDLVLGRRLEPVLDERRADGREHAGAASSEGEPGRAAVRDVLRRHARRGRRAARPPARRPGASTATATTSCAPRPPPSRTR